MEKIGIFVASSLNELHEERLQLGDFVRKLNDIGMERGVYLRLFLCEDESIAMADVRKQEEFNRQLRESRICMVLLFNRAGRYTVEEYGIARCTLDDFAAIEPSAVLGRRETPYGIEALLRREDAPSGFELGRVDIEELFILMAKGEK